MLRTQDLDYDLPGELIAAHPVDPRDSARMLVVRAAQGSTEHRTVRDLPSLLSPSDAIVLNTSRVLPARFVGRYDDTDGHVEGLYIGSAGPPGLWRCMIKARRLRVGAPLRIDANTAGGTGVMASIVRRDASDPALCVVELKGPVADDLGVLLHVGHPPIPPYIQSVRKASGGPVVAPSDTDRYQTVYASGPGSVAAPTAGLHFTPSLLDDLRAARVERVDVTLHVGPGTFKPVEADFVEDHPIHSEWCSMSEPDLQRLRAARARGSLVLAVGTTAVRTIETYAAIADAHHPEHVETSLLITPGFAWRLTGAMLTNFHLPRSTLMALVAALLPGGVPQLQDIYATAIRERYRFYSYGDAMLVLP